jgi:hypothetical protein
MLGHGPIGSLPIGAVQPTPFPNKQADLLAKLRGELNPEQLQRWAPFLDVIIEQLRKRGRKRKQGLGRPEQMAADLEKNGFDFEATARRFGVKVQTVEDNQRRFAKARRQK